jgi:hypothetical protein
LLALLKACLSQDLPSSSSSFFCCSCIDKYEEKNFGEEKSPEDDSRRRLPEYNLSEMKISTLAFTIESDK